MALRGRLRSGLLEEEGDASEDQMRCRKDRPRPKVSSALNIVEVFSIVKV